MTLREKAEYYDEWEPYFESIARIRREVKKGIEYANEEFDDTCKDNTRMLNDAEARTSFTISYLLNNDAEVSVEVDNLMRTMLEDIKDE